MSVYRARDADGAQAVVVYRDRWNRSYSRGAAGEFVLCSEVLVLVLCSGAVTGSSVTVSSVTVSRIAMR